MTGQEQCSQEEAGRGKIWIRHGAKLRFTELICIFYIHHFAFCYSCLFPRVGFIGISLFRLLYWELLGAYRQLTSLINYCCVVRLKNGKAIFGSPIKDFMILFGFQLVTFNLGQKHFKAKFISYGQFHFKAFCKKVEGRETVWCSGSSCWTRRTDPKPSEWFSQL